MTDNPTPSGANQQERSNERDDVAAVIALVRSEVEHANFGGGVAIAARRLLQPLQRSSEYGSLRRHLTELQRDLSAFLASLQKADRELDRLEEMRADSERFGTVWWQQRQRSISEQPSPEQSAEWVTVFAEALLAERFDVCTRLASSEYPALPHDVLLVRLARIGAQAMDEGRWPAAAPLLRLLVDGPWGKRLPPAHRASIQLLLARILMPIAAERSGVRHRLEDALAQPGESDAERALFAVGLGECSLAGGDLDAAEESFGQAAVLNPADPAPYVGLGLVKERRRNWFAALDQYDQAVERVPDRQALSCLQAPVSGNLYWRLAIKLAGGQKSLETSDPEIPVERRQAALDAIDTALRLGISGLGGSPDRRVLIYRAALIESLGRSQEAADAYFAVSQRFQSLTEDAAACKYLEKACDLGPTVPVHHWTLAETLRRLAYDKAARADPEQLDQSIQRWRVGAAIRQPASDEVWAYMTLAFAKMDREEPTKRSTLWEVAALSERAVLLDGTYALGWAVLALAHNGIGNPRTALAAANRALAEDSSESIALCHRTLALAYLERGEEAVQTAQLLTNGSTGGLWPRLYALLVANQAEVALSLLSDLPVESDALLRTYRAICSKRLNRDADEIEDLRWIWEHRDDDSIDPGMVGWAAYRLGYYDSAEERYWQIVDIRDQSELEPDAACDLGQVFLERGDAARHDFGNGEALLKAGICQHTLSSLTQLEEVELPQLLRRIAGKPHADRAAAIVGDALALLRERHAALADSSVTPQAEMRRALDLGLVGRPVSLVTENHGAGPADPVAEEGTWRSARRQAAYAASGWLANAEKRWRDAAEAYVALGQEGLPEDAAVGFARAVAAMRAEADDTARWGNLDEARMQYSRLAEQVAVCAPGVQELRSWLLCRMAMASVASGDVDDARSNFEAAAGLMAGRAEDWITGEAGDGPRALARIFAGSIPAFWAQTDGLTSVRADPALTEGARGLIDATLAALSLDDAYRTRRSDVDSSTTFPLTNIVVLSLGPGLVPADRGEHWPVLSTLLQQLRDYIEQAYGIRVPGVRITDDPALAPTGFEILLDGVAVRKGEIPEARSSPGQPPPLDEVVAGLQDVLIGNLGRLFGPDDLTTWAGSSPSATPEDGVVQALGDAETRLRVQRVLRLLLREGVPVTDRRAVLEAIATAVTTGADTLTALRSVRLSMASALPGTQPGTRLEQLPAALESAVAQRLHTEDPGASRPAWQAPRAEADKLVEQLRDYFSSLSADTAVFVRNPGVRFFVARLLSGSRLQCQVLAKDELEAAGRPQANVVDASAEEPTR
jgi:tetratricopeptide (TPR) repeat protein